MTDKQYLQAKNLAKLLSCKRTDNLFSWLNVGKCLHNIDDRLIDDWIELNKKCAKNFNEDDCRNSWNQMQPSNDGIANLHFFASKDSPDEYQKIYRTKLNDFLKNNNNTQFNDSSVAELLMEKYYFRFRCVSSQNWYQFKNHHWNKTNIDKLDHCITELADKCQKINIGLASSFNQYQGDAKDKLDNIIKNISLLIELLNKRKFRDGVIAEWSELAYDSDFVEKLDVCPNLICFKNGIFDLDANIFRDGYPDDYVTLSTGYDYIPYDKNNEHSKAIKDFLKKIQPIKEVRQYLKRLLSSCLSGRIKEEGLNLFTSVGNNGVTTLIDLMKYTLGNLFQKKNPNLLTNNKVSFYEILEFFSDKKGIRMIVFDDVSLRIVNDTILQMMIDDDIICDDDKSFKRQFKSFIVCSDLSNIENKDKNITSRINVVPFCSKFIKMSTEAHVLEKNQFWSDTSLSEKIPQWNKMFMGMLLKSYQKYHIEKLGFPNLVSESTSQLNQ